MKTYKKQTFLIVEDDIFSFMLIKAYFSKQDFELIHVIDGLEAVRLCSNNEKIKIVLMDVQLPEMDGCEATIKIKQIKPSLRVIAVTAHALESDKAKIMQCGFDAYLTKPLSSVRLFETLDKFI